MNNNKLAIYLSGNAHMKSVKSDIVHENIFTTHDMNVVYKLFGTCFTIHLKTIIYVCLAWLWQVDSLESSNFQFLLNFAIYFVVLKGKRKKIICLITQKTITIA